MSSTALHCPHHPLHPPPTSCMVCRSTSVDAASLHTSSMLCASSKMSMLPSTSVAGWQQGGGRSGRDGWFQTGEHAAALMCRGSGGERAGQSKRRPGGSIMCWGGLGQLASRRHRPGLPTHPRSLPCGSPGPAGSCRAQKSPQPPAEAVGRGAQPGKGRTEQSNSVPAAVLAQTCFRTACFANPSRTPTHPDLPPAPPTSAHLRAV
jgi:hypothetical protein